MYGIVLGGGGSKGAYQIGVWKALNELDIKYTAVTGTSVGALNGAFMAQHDFEEALYLWDNMDNTAVMNDMPQLTEKDNNFFDVMRAFTRQIVLKGAVDISPLEELIKTKVDEDRLRKSDVEFGLVTVQVPSMQEKAVFAKDIPQGKLADYLLASASCFPAFKAHAIDDVRYIDGGYRNNIPVDLLEQTQNHIDEIIVVDVDGVGKIKEIKAEKPITLIKSYWDLGNFLIFDGKQCRRNIQLGYLDTMKAFADYEGTIYTFAPNEKIKLDNKYREKLNKIVDVILEKAKIESTNLISEVVVDRLIATIKERMRVKDELKENRAYLDYMSEFCAEIFEFDPINVYSADEFTENIITEYKNTLKENIVILNRIANEKWLSTKILTSTNNKKILMLAIQRKLHKLILEQEEFLAIELVLAMFPKEFMGAVFLEMLIN